MDENDLYQQLRQLVSEACSHPPGNSQHGQNLDEIFRLVWNASEFWRQGAPFYANDLHEILRLLVADACSHPAGSAARARRLTQIYRLVYNRSNKLWQENVPYYNDALQQTWLFFCRNICEANTGRQYDPERANVITWLNVYLKRRLQDFDLQQQRENAKTEFPRTNEEGQTFDPIDNLIAPEHSSEADSMLILKRVREWVETDPDGFLQSVHIKNRPDVNCQVLIIRRLFEDTPWQQLVNEFNLPLSTLANFNKRKCLPRLRKFIEEQGYL